MGLIGDFLFHRFDNLNHKPNSSTSFVGFWFLLLLSIGFGELTLAIDKPETILLDFLSKPFAPYDEASEQCLRDNAIYLKGLDQYSPWALQSKFRLLE
ncbi:hypothetical protein K0M31_017086 [Melipona bicolor]|uniref:Uncharacterized protein n=1 Tax=Melipona bicolor TaxID=60889 RepID=A0AA40FDK1_9HYME|nr:hypothetical protein K0M31_017086 [Melipona bicolor]